MFNEKHRQRELGLCFNCEEHSQRGHVCKPPALILFLEDDLDPVAETKKLRIKDIDLDTIPTTLVSLNAIKLQGTIPYSAIQILVDYRDTLNFIHTD